MLSISFIEKINPRQWSIVKQLVLLYTASTIVIMLIIFCLLYFTLQNSLYKFGTEFLNSEYQLLQELMQKYPQDKALLAEQIIFEPVNEKSENHYYIRILDARQHTLLETPGMNKIYTDLSPVKKSLSIFHWRSLNQNPFLLLSGRIFPADASQPYYIQLALSIDKEEKILQEYGRMFIIVTLIGMLFATLLGIMLARRSMQPLKNIMETVENINMQKLNGRLRPDHWPIEFTALAKNFNDMLERLENSFERLKGFSADLAHELRTPIHNLKGEAEICLSKDRSLEDYRYVLGSSLEEYERLSRIIEGLLFLARTEDPQRKISCTEINAGNLIESIFEYYLPIAEENNIALLYSGQAVIWANDILLQRALHNIISNALRYTSSGGQIRLHLETLPVNETVIHLSDTGAGIAAEHLPYVFDRFYRTDYARAQISGGSGLGLAIVQSIMELHKGQVQISSELGIGTHITLIFPPKR
jgi:two-component system heavy metal sensor histidine kinase CusS